MPKEFPRVNWPEEDGKYKVVQLYFRRKPFLRFGSPKSYHESILGGALNSLGIKKIDEEEGYIIARKGMNNKAVGMGRSEVNVKEKKASFFGMSTDCEIGIDPKHLKKITELERDWNLEIIKFND